MIKKSFVAKMRESGGCNIITVPVEIPTKPGKAYQFSIEVDE